MGFSPYLGYLHPFLLGRVTVLGSLCWNADRLRSQMNNTWQNCGQSLTCCSYTRERTKWKKVTFACLWMNSSVCCVCVVLLCTVLMYSLETKTGIRASLCSMELAEYFWKETPRIYRSSLFHPGLTGVKTTSFLVRLTTWSISTLHLILKSWSREWLHCVGRGFALSKGSAAHFLIPALF